MDWLPNSWPCAATVPQMNGNSRRRRTVGSSAQYLPRSSDSAMQLPPARSFLECAEEGVASARIDELAAVGMIVCAPYQRALTRHFRRAAGFFGPSAPAEQITVADGVVARIQALGAPPELKDSPRHTALIPGIGIDRPPALRRPAHDLDRKSRRFLDEAPVAAKTVIGG